MLLVDGALRVADALPPTVRARLRQLAPGWAIGKLRDLRGTAKLPRLFPHALDQRMSGGFATATVPLLQAIQSRWSTKAGEMGAAGWALARWHFAQGAYARALEQLLIFRVGLPKFAFRNAAQALEVECLTALGRFDEAERSIAQGLGKGEPTRERELCFAAANLCRARGASDGDRQKAEQDRIGWFNRVLESGGFAGIRLADPSKPLAIDNMTTGPLPPDPDVGLAKLSVLMAAHNCEDTVGFAVKSILAQTWTNLELIVVDDASSDGTWAALERLAASDKRMKIIRHERNRGAYGARNTALAAASGDYITVQDSDDWGHPEKLALQMRGVLKDGQRVNATAYVRVAHDLEVIRNQASGSSYGYHRATLLYARSDIDALGQWDDAWMGADSEFEERFAAVFGAKPIVLAEDTPLTFYLSRKTSLTNQAGIGMASLKLGARAEYRECRTYWHELELAKEKPDLKLPRKDGRRPFPAPRICLCGSSEEPQRFDLLYVSDFTLAGCEPLSDLAAREAAHRLGVSQACLFWPRVENIGKAHNTIGRGQIHEGIVATVVAEEKVECDLAVADFVALANLPDKPPAVRAKACVVLCAETPVDRGKLARVIENARAVFGVEPLLAPVFATVRRALQEAGEGARLTETDWLPIVEPARPGRQRSVTTEAPVVGREASNDPREWPSSVEAIRAAYCALAPVRVRVLGTMTNKARGALADAAAVQPQGSDGDLAEFINSLDFYIYHPHEGHAEPVSRGPLEAMAAGVPVAMPPRFAENFGKAAVYAEPEDVADTILKLWRDPAQYQAQAQRGRDFIAKQCSAPIFEERIARFVSVPKRDTAPSAGQA